MKASVSPAATESFQPAQHLASPSNAETPKTGLDTINQESSAPITLSSIIVPASNGKDIYGPVFLYEATKNGAAERDPHHQTVSSQAASTTNPLMRQAIHTSTKHLAINPSPPPAASPPTASVRSSRPAHGTDMQPASPPLSTALLGHLTGFLAMPRERPGASQPRSLAPGPVGRNAITEHSTQATLMPVDAGTFFAVDHVEEVSLSCVQLTGLLADPQVILPLPSVLSQRASFPISLFQMINYSTASLHCDLSVRLRNRSGCER
ncbi:hypothetical protein P4O66_017648, partial [Electrophorus voltai]